MVLFKYIIDKLELNELVYDMIVVTDTAGFNSKLSTNGPRPCYV